MLPPLMTAAGAEIGAIEAEAALGSRDAEVGAADVTFGAGVAMLCGTQPPHATAVARRTAEIRVTTPSYPRA